MIYAVVFPLLALVAAVSFFEARSHRDAFPPATPAEHAQLARMYARRAQNYGQSSQRQQQVDGFLADYYRLRADRMHTLELEHRQRSI